MQIHHHWQQVCDKLENTRHIEMESLSFSSTVTTERHHQHQHHRMYILIPITSRTQVHYKSQ